MFRNKRINCYHKSFNFFFSQSDTRAQMNNHCEKMRKANKKCDSCMFGIMKVVNFSVDLVFIMYVKMKLIWILCIKLWIYSNQRPFVMLIGYFFVCVCPSKRREKLAFYFCAQQPLQSFRQSHSCFFQKTTNHALMKRWYADKITAHSFRWVAVFFLSLLAYIVWCHQNSIGRTFFFVFAVHIGSGGLLLKN